MSTALDNEAAAYVERHALEEHLSAAVDAAIKAKAPDALAFISEYLCPTGTGGGASPDVHVKARSQDNPDYPQRSPVTDALCQWSAHWPEYQPKPWTSEIVLKNCRDLSSGGKWADPVDASLLRDELEKRVTYCRGGQARCLKEAIDFDSSGRPLNPMGRTGLADRGLLGKWGPNHAADPIVTRYHPTTGQLQVVAIQRKDTGQWALPGGMVDPGECVSQTVLREFTEEAGNIEDLHERADFERLTAELFRNGGQIYRGYVDDPRITDHAWIETTAFHFHCPREVGDKLPLAAGDDAGKVMWLDVSTASKMYQSLYGGHRALIDKAVLNGWSSGQLHCTMIAPM